ncbi:unnamed protein product [Schistosoma mattheei]|uniref:Uncharacterized protein n=1 Tax=Schistosoma mattheei TaxID=31246 RepID=A0A3P7Y032_9TREM|nr:unnamed protein product [Schistosoma mattheei]
MVRFVLVFLAIEVLVVLSCPVNEPMVHMLHKKTLFDLIQFLYVHLVKTL